MSRCSADRTPVHPSSAPATTVAPATPPVSPPGLRSMAQEAFARDLPQLLKESRGHWVAYLGGQQVAIATHTQDIHDRCVRQGLSRDQVVLFEIVDPDEALFLGPIGLD